LEKSLIPVSFAKIGQLSKKDIEIAMEGTLNEAP
jgi:hypothetical protein